MSSGLAFLFVSLFLAQGSTPVHDPLRGGIVVESVTRYSEAERAGIREGDILLSWERSDRKGNIESPFDLFMIELREAPQGPVTLAGLRGAEVKSWAIGADDWGIQARPNLPGELSEIYRQGKDLSDASKPAEAAERWRAAAAQVKNSGPAWLGPWLLLRAGVLLAENRQFKEADDAYQTAVHQAADAEPIVMAQVLHTWGDSFRKRSEWDKAENYYRQSIAQAGEVTDESALAALALYKIGLVGYKRGDLAKAEESHRHALALEEKLAPEGLGVARNLNGLGDVADDRGDLAKADEYQHKALAIQEKLAPNSLSVARSFKGLGDVALDHGNLVQAEQYYAQSLSIRKRILPDSLEVASSLNGLGLTAWQHGDLAKAEEYHLEALAIREKLAPESMELAASFNNLAVVAHARGDLAKAEEYQLKDLAIGKKLAPGSLGVAISLNNIGTTVYNRGDLARAEDYFNQALEIRQKLSPRSLDTATVFTNLGRIARVRGDLVKAEEYCNRALEIQQKLAPNSLSLAGTLSLLGGFASARGDWDNAEALYRQSLAIQQKLAAGTLDVASSLNNLGNLARSRGNLDQAEEYFRQDYEITTKFAPGSLGQAAVLNDLGILARDRRDLDKAEDYLRRALAIRKRLSPESLTVAGSYENLGLILTDRGDLVAAEQYLHQSLALWEKLAPGSLQVPDVLSNLGFATLERGSLASAEGYFQQALAIYRKVAPGRLEIGHCLNNLGWVARARGNLDQAEAYEREALAIREKIVPGGLLVAWSLNSLADVARDRGDLAGAEAGYRRALEIRQKLAPGSMEHAETLATLAAVLREEHQLDAAAQLYAQAIDSLEGQTARLGGSAEVRSGFRARHADYYRSYIDVLMQQAKPELAFQVLERSRARALLEVMAQAHVDIRQGVDADLLARERSLQESIRAKTDVRLQLLNQKHAEDRSSLLDQEIKELLRQYQELEGQIRESSPTYAALTQPQPLALSQLQREVLDADSLLLEYSLGADRSYLFVLSSTSLSSYELPGRAAIEKSARLVYSLLTARNHRVKGDTELQRTARLHKAAVELPQAAAGLSRMILGPAASELQSKRLLVVSDGALAYIPFALLPEPTATTSRTPAPLIASHEILNLPSGSVVAALRQQEAQRKLPPRTVAVLADPVFSRDDSRVIDRRTPRAGDEVNEGNSPQMRSADLLVRSAGDLGLERDGEILLNRLRFTRAEAEAIALVTPRDQRMQALDFRASRELATSPELAQYRIIHFATHGLLDSRHPELSGLVLSLVDEHGKQQNGFLELEDIYNLKLSAELVVLSACETGLGQEIDGEGLVGLARGFMYAGASRVVASLWNVSDAGTAELMRRFYQAMEKQGMRSAAALRAAQVQMWKQQRWRDPYYWAGFQIQGEWK